MKTKHTPGPWHVYEGGNFVKIGAVGYDEYVKEHRYLAGPFCVGEAEHNATENYGPDHELAMANACLIAAAPDLLEALRDTTAILKQYVEDDGGHEAAYERLNDNDHLIAKIEA